jgi:hypothetical protein
MRDGHVSPKPWSTELICFQICRRYYGFARDGRRISGGDVFPVGCKVGCRFFSLRVERKGKNVRVQYILPIFNKIKKKVLKIKFI